MAEPSATPTVLTDNDRVRVTRWVFAAGEATGHHRHAYDYVVAPQSDGTLLIRSADGEQRAELRRDAPYFREAGVEHDVINASGHEIAFVEIEIK